MSYQRCPGCGENGIPSRSIFQPSNENLKCVRCKRTYAACKSCGGTGLGDYPFGCDDCGETGVGPEVKTAETPK